MNNEVEGTDMEFDDQCDGRFDDRNAHDEMDRIIVDVELTKDDTGDSLNVDSFEQIDKEIPDKQLTLKIKYVENLMRWE